MGINETSDTSLADALFTRVQQRVLGLLFAQPDRSFLATEVIRLANVGTGAVHRELGKLAGSGLVTVTAVGRQRHYQANRASPIFSDLHGLVLKTVGLAEPLREALTPLAEQITVAFVYGSVARGTDTTRSDVDLMVLSNDLAYAELFTALQRAEERIGRRVNPNLLTTEEWRKKRAEESHFVSSIAAQGKIFILGSVNDLD
jgi:predicted nucleotidyltransferase